MTADAVALGSLPGVSSLSGSLVGAGMSAVMSGMSQWVVDGAKWLIDRVGAYLTSTSTDPALAAGWFHSGYHAMTVIAAALVVPFLLMAAVQSIVRQDPGLLCRAVVVQLPLAALLTGAAVEAVRLATSAVDHMSTALAAGTNRAPGALSSLAGGLGGLDPSGQPAFVAFLVGLLVAVGAFLLWLELVVRACAIYVAVLFLPLGLATMVWPAASRWSRRMTETLIALVLSKLVVVGALSLAAAQVAGGGFAALVGGTALLFVAVAAPFALLRLIPLAELGAVGHMEGILRRPLARVARAPAGVHAVLAQSAARAPSVAEARGNGPAPTLAVLSGPPHGGRPSDDRAQDRRSDGQPVAIGPHHGPREPARRDGHGDD